MKKTAILIISTLLILGFSLKSLRAQGLDSNKTYQDYQFQLDTYNNSYSDYQHAKDFYLSNQTLSLKEDARQKTLTMLKSRDQLFVTYLTAIRAKIADPSGLTDDEKNNIFGKIDSEVSWYKDHIGNYKDSDSLTDLFNKSSESESRYKTNTSQVIYESLFTLTYGQEVSARESHERIYQTLKASITTPDPYGHFFSDIDAVIATLKQNEAAGKTQIQGLYGQYSSDTGSYDESIQTLNSSLKSLKQFNEFLMELTTSVNNQK